MQINQKLDLALYEWFFWMTRNNFNLLNLYRCSELFGRSDLTFSQIARILVFTEGRWIFSVSYVGVWVTVGGRIHNSKVRLRGQCDSVPHSCPTRSVSGLLS